MVDNVGYTPGTGATIATDEIGGIHYQINKLVYGPLDTATPVTAAQGLPAVPGSANTSASAPAPVTPGTRVDQLYDLFGRAAVTDFDPETGASSALTSLRDGMVAQRYTILSDSIADGLASFWTISGTISGAVAVTGGEGLIQSGTDPAGAAQMSSTAPAYFPGQSHWLNSAIRFGDTGSAGNIRRIGAFTVSGTTPQDGFFFELNGTTLNAVSVKGGVQTPVASTSWTRVAAAPFTLDTNYHSFEIRWTANGAQFYVDNVVRHTASGGGAAITNTLNFPMTIQSVNSSGATSRLIAVRNIGLGRFGTPDGMSSASPLAVAKAQSAPYSAGDVGVPAMAVRRAVPTSSTVDGNYEPLQSSNGRLWATAQVDSAPTLEAVLGQILVELKVVSSMLQIGLTTSTDPADLRDDYLRSLN
jgi:hypothetical protein